VGRATAVELSEIGATVELEITVGMDGFVRDFLFKKTPDRPINEAMIDRAVFNSRFQPGTLEGKPVTVRIPFSVTMSAR